MLTQQSECGARIVFAGGVAFGIPCVGLLPTDLQKRCLCCLQQLIRDSSAYGRGREQGSVTALQEPGSILVLFQEDPGAALDCAAEVCSRTGTELPDAPASAVVHSGACYLTTGFDGRPTLVGGVVQMLRDLLQGAHEHEVLIHAPTLEEILQRQALSRRLAESGWPVERFGAWFRKFIVVDRR